MAQGGQVTCLKSHSYKYLSQVLNRGSYDSEALGVPLHTSDSEGWIGVPSYDLFSGRFWNEELLQDVCAGLAEELQLAPDAPGGMIEFRRTLTLSFFFKFYLTVLQKLGKVDSEDVSEGPGQGTDSLQHFCLGIWEAGVGKRVLWTRW